MLYNSRILLSIILIVLVLGAQVRADVQLRWAGECDQVYARYGHTVNSAGDVNGDGYVDIIIGAYYYDNDQYDEGRAFVYHGSAAGLSATPDWIGEGDQSETRYSDGACTAGDVNGDGYGDVVVGAHAYDHGHTDEGCAYLYYGSPSGLSTTPSWFTEGNLTWGLYGNEVSSADVNNDGYTDVIIGSPHEDNRGRAFVYHGSPAGLSTTADWIGEDPTRNRFGFSVSTAGDVNGDGYEDIIVGASAQLPYITLRPGRAYAYYGGPSGLPPDPDWTAESDQSESDYAYCVSTAGDVNGDGYDDIVIGARWYSNGQYHEGRAYVHYGSGSGLSVAPDWIAEIDQPGAELGFFVSDAGDVNSDGYDDVIIGAPYYDNGEIDEGCVLIYLGGPLGLSNSADFLIEGNQTGATFGWGLSTAGDIDMDGYSEFLCGAPLYDNGESNEGMAFAYSFLPDVVSATVDIDPDVLNDKSLGVWITCYIELPEGYSAEDIDVTTVEMIEADGQPFDPPLQTVGPYSVGDEDEDGILDLMVKFDRQELIAQLNQMGVMSYVELTVHGTLDDGTEFEGYDTVLFLRKNHSHGPHGQQVVHEIPRDYRIVSCEPNPFHDRTTITYTTPSVADVTLSVYDVNGRLVNILVDKRLHAGYYTVLWDGVNEHGETLPNGVYLLRFETDDYKTTQKLLFVK